MKIHGISSSHNAKVGTERRTKPKKPQWSIRATSPIVRRERKGCSTTTNLKILRTMVQELRV